MAFDCFSNSESNPSTFIQNLQIQRVKKIRTPPITTMESSHQDDKLHQKLMNLQQDWDSFKQRRSYSAKRHSSNAMVKALQLLETSPRNLMSSLQHSMLSPSNLQGPWKVRTNDFAVQEIIRERREAIETGKVKGRRRLFHDVDDDDDDDETDDQMGFEVRSVSFNHSDGNESDGSNDDQINPFRFEACSYSGSSSSWSLPGDLNVMVEGDEDTKVSNGGGGINIGGRFMVNNVMLKWVVISCFVFAFFFFIITCFFGYDGGETQYYKVILVPT